MDTQPVSLPHQGERSRTPDGSNSGELGDSKVHAALDAVDLGIWDWSTFFAFPVEFNADPVHNP